MKKSFQKKKKIRYEKNVSTKLEQKIFFVENFVILLFNPRSGFIFHFCNTFSNIAHLLGIWPLLAGGRG